MATSKEYLNFILGQLSGINGITYRQMMGEYIIYYNAKITAYICDNRLLVMPVAAAIEMMPEACYAKPYEGAKDMLLVDDVDNKEFLQALFDSLYIALPETKK